jgi:hypothetical protein
MLEEIMKPDRIYTADNFILCWLGLLTRILVFEKKMCLPMQSSKESLMIMCCANVSGNYHNHFEARV